MSASIVSRSPVLARWRRIPGPPRDVVKARLLRLYRGLLDRFGPQGPGPGRTAFEVAVGAIVTRDTGPANAASVIGSLRRARLLSPKALDRASHARLGQTLGAAGTHRSKARPLKAFTRWLMVEHGGRFDGLRRAPLASLRNELLAIPGLGRETADAILLHAAHRPVFVADAYARRALAAEGLVPAAADYERARRLLEAHLPSDPALFSEFHALLVAAGERGRGSARASGRVRRTRR